MDQNRLIEALKAADAAGDVQAATALAQALRGMGQSTPAAKAAPPAQMADTRQMINRGLTAGLSDYPAAAGKYLADKIGGGLESISGKDLGAGDKSFEQSLQEVRGGNAAFREESPVRAYGGEIVGGIASPIFRGVAKGTQYGLDKAAQFMGKTVPKYLGYGFQGGTQGVTAGIANAQNEKGGVPSLKDVGKSAGVMGATGVGLGIAAPALAETGGKVVQKAANWMRPQPGAMTQPQFQAASRAAYKEAEAAGVVVKPDAFKQFVDDLPGQLEGYRPRIAPKAESVIAEMQADVAAGKPITLELLDELRRVASGAAKTIDRNEIRLISSIVEKIDDFVDDLQPAQILAGDAQKGVAALNRARDLYRTNMKLRNIDDILEIGENLNDTNWTRNQFRAIVRKPKLFNQYSADEQKLIKELARTGTMENLARLQPLRGVQMAAPHIAQVGQDMKAARLQDLIARGGSTQPSTPAIPPAALEFIARGVVPGSTPMLSPSMTGGSNQKPYRER